MKQINGVTQAGLYGKICRLSAMIAQLESVKKELVFDRRILRAKLERLQRKQKT